MKIDSVEWWTDVRPQVTHVQPIAGDPCDQCGAPATVRCAGITSWQQAEGCSARDAPPGGKLWEGCTGALCGACGSDLGLPTKPLRFCSFCRPLDLPGVTPGRAGGSAPGSAHYSARVAFGASTRNRDGITLTPVSLAGVSFMRVDMGDKLHLSDALCEALGVPTGTLEPNQCVLLHTALALLGWECGPPGLLGLPPVAPEVLDRIRN